MSEAIHPLFDLSDRVALVTGGGSGLGREYCDVLAEFGATVVCCDLIKDRADETCEIISKYRHKTEAVQADVADYAQVREMFQGVENAFGRLDILVNNAGISTRPVPFAEIDLDEWHKLQRVNLDGTFYCMREGLGIMVKQKRGSIINISSIAGVNAARRPAASYVASKAAVIGLTKQGAFEYGQYGIRVNCIAPGYHLGTRFLESSGAILSDDEYKALGQTLASLTPLRRTGEPRDLKGLLLYLASDASSFLTGQTILHDGGWTLE